MLNNRNQRLAVNNDFRGYTLAHITLFKNTFHTLPLQNLLPMPHQKTSSKDIVLAWGSQKDHASPQASGSDLGEKLSLKKCLKKLLSLEERQKVQQRIGLEKIKSSTIIQDRKIHFFSKSLPYFLFNRSNITKFMKFIHSTNKKFLVYSNIFLFPLKFFWLSYCLKNISCNCFQKSKKLILSARLLSLLSELFYNHIGTLSLRISLKCSAFFMG